MAIWSSEIKELEKLYESLGGKFPELEKELQSLINTDDENVALLYSRRCLEIIITDLCECELKKSRGTEPLKGIIDKLQKEEKVPSHIIASMHGLNTLATFGTHPKDFDPEQVKPVLNNLLIIVKWYLGYKDPVSFSKLKAEEEKFRAGQAGVFAKIDRRLRKRTLLLISGVLFAVIITFTALVISNVIKLDSRIKGDKSIAVLPFAIPGNDTTQEYISYGLVEEILNRLCRIGNLKVISHTSSARFKNSDLSLKEIARELGASAILEGSMQKSGNKMRITVQLIDAKTDTHLWSNKYDNVLSDIFSIYSEVAQSVARELNAVINPEEKQLIEKRPTANMEAWDAYQKGVFFHSRLSKEDLETALHYFELAIEKDPEFALAYAGIGRVWRGREQMGIVSPSEATPRAEAAIIKALELDTTYSEIYHALGGLMTWSKWNWKAGEAAFRKAVELNPKNADAHSTFSHLLGILGRPDEALKHIETAVELDPLNPKILSFYGGVLGDAGRYDDAIKAYQKALDLNPTQGVAGNIIGALYASGREEEAVKMQKERWKNDPERLKAFEEGYAEADWPGAHKRVGDLYVKRSETSYVGPGLIANCYYQAGDMDKAIYWLEMAYKEHGPNLPYAFGPKNYILLKDDPRYQELARKMNLPLR
jgi:TolB-like protein/Tfp pilus assembly protein PilF